MPIGAGRRLEPGEEGEVAAAERRGEVGAVEPREVDLHLVGGPTQRGDGRERQAGEVNQPVDQIRQRIDGDRLDAGFGGGDSSAVSRPDVLPPLPLGESGSRAAR